MHVVEVSSSIKHLVSIGPLADGELKGITKKKYSFNWKKEKGYDIYKLYISGDEDILGLMSLAFYDNEYRVHVRLLSASTENIGKGKIYQRIAGSLFGFAAALAIKKYGENAAISLRPKTEPGQYYMNEFGFEQVGISLFLEGAALHKLLKKFQ